MNRPVQIAFAAAFFLATFNAAASDPTEIQARGPLSYRGLETGLSFEQLIPAITAMSELRPRQQGSYDFSLSRNQDEPTVVEGAVIWFGSSCIIERESRNNCLEGNISLVPRAESAVNSVNPEVDYIAHQIDIKIYFASPLLATDVIAAFVRAFGAEERPYGAELILSRQGLFFINGDRGALLRCARSLDREETLIAGCELMFSDLGGMFERAQAWIEAAIQRTRSGRGARARALLP